MSDTKEISVPDDLEGPNGGRIEFCDGGDVIEHLVSDSGKKYIEFLERGFQSKDNAIETLGVILDDLYDTYPVDGPEPPAHIAYVIGLTVGRIDALAWTSGADWQ